MPIFTNRLEAKLKELGVLEKAKRYAIKTFDDCDNGLGLGEGRLSNTNVNLKH